MEITITINGKPVQATVDDAVIREAMGEKKTGYERNEGNSYYIVLEHGDVQVSNDELSLDDVRYKVANYYSDFAVAQNNARADKLMRQLRRFAAEHGGCVPPKKTIKSSVGHSIYWDGKKPDVCSGCVPDFGRMWFASNNAAYSAIVAFHDELMWYFTEYDPMPKGWWDK